MVVRLLKEWLCNMTFRYCLDESDWTGLGSAILLAFDFCPGQSLFAAVASLR